MRHLGVREVLCCKHKGCPTLEVRDGGVMVTDDDGAEMLLSDEEAMNVGHMLSNVDEDEFSADGDLVVVGVGDEVRLFRLSSGVRMSRDEADLFLPAVERMLVDGDTPVTNLEPDGADATDA